MDTEPRSRTPKSAPRSPRRAATQTGVPPELTSFVGRERELEAVSNLLNAGARLLTLFGPAGIGKTRLATRLLSERVDPVRPAFFCDLRAASSATGLCTELSRCLEARLSEGDSLAESVEALGRVLAAHANCVVVLDNLEHLVEAAPETLHHWLRSAPEAQFVVTSRRTLRLKGEQIYELGPLALPMTPDDRDCASMQLFVERASSVEPSFNLDSPQAQHVEPLVRRLEGIPLAIELAAGQMRRSSPRDVLRQMNTGPLALTSREQDSDPRHATLRAALGQSWQRLTPWERSALGQLTVFHGGFTLEAAEAVLDVGPRQVAPSAADLIASLRDSSFLRVASTKDPAGGARWDMYEAIREYAAETLDEETANATRQRHATYYSERSERWAAKPHLMSPEAQAALATELDNLRCAFFWWLSLNSADRSGDLMRTALAIYVAVRYRMPTLGKEVSTHALEHVVRCGCPENLEPVRTQLLLARADLCREVGSYDQAKTDLETAARIVPRDAPLAAEIEYQKGVLLYVQGQAANARSTLEEALQMARAVYARHLEGRIRTRIAWVLAEAFYDPDAFRHYAQAAALLHEAGDTREETAARIHWCAHRIFFQRGDPSPELEAQIAAARRLEDRTLEAHGLFALGMSRQEHGDLDVAEHCFRDARSLAARSGLRRKEACADKWLGKILDERGRVQQASDAYQRAAATLGHLGELRSEGICHTYLAGLVARSGDPDRARDLLEQARQLLIESGDPGLPAVAELQLGQVELAEAQRAGSQGARERSDTLRRQAMLRIAKAKTMRWTGRKHAVRSPPPERSEVARFVLRLLERTVQSQKAERPSVLVWADGGAFRIGDQPPVTLPRGPVGRRLLRALAEERVRRPGRALSTDALVTHGWPDERILSEAAHKRVGTAIWRLRKVGLDTLLLTSESGYLLDPSMPLQITDGTTQPPKTP